MRNRIIDAFLYLFVFIAIQFVVTYAVLFAWLAVHGKGIAQLGKGFANGSLPYGENGAWCRPTTCAPDRSACSCGRP